MKEQEVPKKNGITKTYSFDKKTVDMMNEMCKSEHRTQTNFIEMLIIEKYRMKGENLCQQAVDLK